ncbi:MAG: TIGR03089 family protein [Nocardioidaceae bacterium]
MPEPILVTSALANALSADPGRPLVTFYDARSGERIELSVKTFDNWVSKIANLLGDELGFELGQSIRVELAPHWLSTVIVVAAWATGLRLLPSGTPQLADVSIVGPQVLEPDRVGSVAGGVVIGCSLRPLGGPFLQPLPAGWLDFAREVPGQPDIMLSPSQISGEDVAVERVDGDATHTELAQAGLRAAARLGLEPGGRLITDANPADSTEVVDALVAPLVTGSSVVLVAGADAATRGHIAEQEQAGCSLWLDR